MLQVLRYLQAFAAAFQLHQYVTFDTEVIKAVPLFPNQKAVEQTQQQAQQQQQQQQQPQQQQRQSVNSGAADGSNADGQAQSQTHLPWPQWKITTKPVRHSQSGNGSNPEHTAEMTNGDQKAGGAHANGFQNSDAAHANGHSQENSAGNAQPCSDRQTDGQSQTATYDALVVCNGHYSAPRCPEVSGSEAFPGTVMHSHNYRENTAFTGQTVVLVGASASGEDICREIAEVADKVKWTMF